MSEVQIKALRQIVVGGGQVINPGEIVAVGEAEAYAAVTVHKSAEYVGKHGTFDPDAPGENVPSEAERRMEAGLPAAERSTLADERTKRAQESQLADDVKRAEQTRQRIANRSATAGEAQATAAETRSRKARAE